MVAKIHKKDDMMPKTSERASTLKLNDIPGAIVDTV
jgi:hypothetical protein